MKHSYKAICSICNGTGYVGEWSETKKDGIKYTVEDCQNCQGKGRVEVKILDNRSLSKNKTLLYPEKY